MWTVNCVNCGLAIEDKQVVFAINRFWHISCLKVTQTGCKRNNFLHFIFLHNYIIYYNLIYITKCNIGWIKSPVLFKPFKITVCLLWSQASRNGPNTLLQKISVVLPKRLCPDFRSYGRVLQVIFLFFCKITINL